MRILITGIKGFMGAHLSHFYGETDHVCGIDNDFHSCNLAPKGYVQNVDIRDIEAMDTIFRDFDPEVVVHLAAQIHVDYSIKYPQETIDINVKGTANVLELCKKYKTNKCVIASTSEIYGGSQTHLMSELHPLDCQSPYGASKVAADRLAKSYIDTFGMNIVIIRNFNAFGPYQNDGSYGSVIARFAKAALANEPLYIYGTGEQSRDYMYIDDIMQAYSFAIEKLPAGVYNFGTGTAYTINDIAKRIVDITRSKSEIFHVAARAGEVERLCCDIAKAKSCGFIPTTDFDRDLTKYLDWYGKQK